MRDRKVGHRVQLRLFSSTREDAVALDICNIHVHNHAGAKITYLHRGFGEIDFLLLSIRLLSGLAN